MLCPCWGFLTINHLCWFSFSIHGVKWVSASRSILSAVTKDLTFRHIKHHLPLVSPLANTVYSVSQKNPPPRFFLTFFPKRLGMFNPNFTHQLYDPIYARLQMFSQLPPTVTKLCHIKRNHHYILKMYTIG